MARKKRNGDKEDVKALRRRVQASLAWRAVVHGPWRCQRGCDPPTTHAEADSKIWELDTPTVDFPFEIRLELIKANKRSGTLSPMRKVAEQTREIIN